MRLLALVRAFPLLLAVTTSAYAQSTVTVSVPALASLYGDSDSIPPVPVPLAVPAGQSLQILAPGCVVADFANCEDANGAPDGTPHGLFRGLPVYGLIGQWSTSPA